MDNFIKKTWEIQAKKFKSSHWVSWGDVYAIDLEIENILKHVAKGDRVLDVGCANGYSTFQIAQKKPKKIIGIDFADNMIKYANKSKKKSKLGDIIEFKVGNAKKLEFKDSHFDLVYTTRVLINLPNWQEQKKAINECIRVTKKGGTIIFSEAFWEPLVLLNSIRALKQLSPLVEHDFNRYLKKQKFESFLKKKKLRYKVNDFSSIYYLGSRFLRELVTDHNKYPGYSNPINKIFFEIEKKFSGGGFGIQQAYIIKK